MSTSRSLQGGVPFQANPSMNDARLSLHSTDSLGEGSTAGTIYIHRHKGDKIALYDGTNWALYTLAETAASLALTSGTTSKPNDVFAYASGTTVTLELLAWTSDTARATAIVMQDGVWSKTGALTRRYVGTVYVDASDQATDNSTQRAVWNENHRVQRYCEIQPATGSWTYSTAAYRQADASTLNQVELMLGRAVETVIAINHNYFNSTTEALGAYPGIGIDSTTVNSSAHFGSGPSTTGRRVFHTGYYEGSLLGYRDIVMLEQATAATVTWYGTPYTAMTTSSWH